MMQCYCILKTVSLIKLFWLLVETIPWSNKGFGMKHVSPNYLHLSLCTRTLHLADAALVSLLTGQHPKTTQRKNP